MVLALRAAGHQVVSISALNCAVADVSVVCDTADEAALASAMASLGDLAGLVCLPGSVAACVLAAMTWNHWRQIMAQNAGGVMLAMKHASLQLRAGSAIVLVTTAMTASGESGSVAHHAATGAVLGLMRAGSGAFAPRNIRVNAINIRCGTVFASDGHTQINKAVPPADIAAAVMVLLSAEASFVTGSEWVLDGNLSG